MVYQTASDINFSLVDVPAVPRPRRVLLTTPAHFDIAYVINPHMAGNIGGVDQDRAAAQWEQLHEAYTTVDIPVSVLDGVEGLPDMVFCANQTLPYLDPRTGVKGVYLSRMHAPQRRGEVSHAAAFFRKQGYETHLLPKTPPFDFEGMGDAIWHPRRFLLWGGYGFRTDLAAYRYISAHLDVRIITLRLTAPDFYHLDTCFSVLSPTAVLIYPGAFDDDGRALIRHIFETVIEAPDEEARQGFACNAHCPDEHHVIIQRGSSVTNHLLREAGFTPVEVDTGEFIKAGGSVFCMKQMFW